MVAIHGASPSGRAVVGREIPELVPGRLTGDVAEELRAFFCEGARAVLVFRAPDVGFALPGTLDFGGDPLGDAGLLCSDRTGVRAPTSSTSSNSTWLPTLPLLARAPLVAIESPFQAPLPFRLLGSGESRSTKVCGTGTGLVLAIGMREVLGLSI